MAKVQLSVMQTIVLAYGALEAVAAKNSFENPTPIDTWLGQRFPPQPRPGFYKYLGDCIDNTTQACSVNISKAILGNGQFNNPACCKKVVEAGFLCNRAFNIHPGKVQQVQGLGNPDFPKW